jgi:hypothetical protein
MTRRAHRGPPLFALFASAFALVDAQASAHGCLPWGDQDDINARLQGPGAVVELCPNAIFELTGPVVFSADRQTRSSAASRARRSAPTWGCYPPEQTVESLTSFGATVVDNVLRGGPYHDGFVVDAVRDFTVTGNRAEGTVYRGVPTLDCHGRLAAPPAPFLIDRDRASGTFQPEFRDGIVSLALWAVQGE